MPKKKPTYLLRKPTGQARVRIDGRDIYLGEYGSPASRERYDDLVADRFARNVDIRSYKLTIDDLVLLYLDPPEEETTSRPSARLHDARFDFDLRYVEELAGFEFREDRHVHLGQKIHTGVDGYVTHSRPGGDEPGMIDLRLHRYERSLSISETGQNFGLTRSSQPIRFEQQR